MQEHKHKFAKACFCCKNVIWHVEPKHILQSPEYLIFIVKIFKYINNEIIKNTSLIPLNLNIMLGS